MERWPEPVRGELLISETRHKEPQASAASPEIECHAALVTGDLQRLAPPLGQSFQGANVVSEVKEEGGGDAVAGATPATFGPSGTRAPLKLSYLVLRSY